MGKKKKTIEELLEESLVVEEVQPYQVPENWIWINLGSCLESIQYGYTETASSEEIGPKFLRITDIQNDKVDWNSVPYCKINEKDLKKYLLKDDDIVVARTGATTGKSYLINKPAIAVFASYLIRLRKSKGIYPKYLWNYMKSPMYWKQIMVVKKGSAQPGANAQILSNLSLPLPPLNEQKRIAEKVENLLKKIEEAKTLIEEAKETFELRRAAILDKAFRGKLTKEWHGQHTIKNIDVEYLNEPFKIPQSWRWIQLGEILEMQNGLSKRRGTTGKNIPVLRLADIKNGKIVTNDLREILLTEKETEKYKLKMNDLMFIRVNGSFDLVGKAIVFDIPLDAAYCDHLIRATIKSNEVNSRYISYFFESPFMREQLRSKIVSSAGQNTISQGSLLSLWIPIPPKEECEQLVIDLENVLSKEQKILEKMQEMDKLKRIQQSILSKAFCGELGTNDPTEESAIELLKDVLQEKIK
ncbi:restriction endonuclease subunit S [Bacillus sp. FF-1]|uniref:restriction endonuclease subunit S n=1 Tax=Bacillus sp. FF-1 TaxID=3025192 RepID=UPI00234F622D|nr:restriction endonuclease subunit S [Bacillus sp. FF-1]MDC7739549.1 restriction endonuclease subunit S [Bacillus sp. FF-1]